MSRIKITYLGANGVFRNATGEIETRFPTVVRNKRDGQRHTLIERPIFQETTPIELEHFHDLFSMPTPVIEKKMGKQRMLCEENSLYPITTETTVDWKNRLFARKSLHLQGVQHARNRASHLNNSQAQMGMMSMVVTGVVILLTIVFAFVGLSAHLEGRAQGEEQEVQQEVQPSGYSPGSSWYKVS